MALLHNPTKEQIDLLVHEINVQRLKDLLHQEFGSSHTALYPGLQALLSHRLAPLRVLSSRDPVPSLEEQQVLLAAVWPQSMPKTKP